jgi:hypothetical protein
MKGDMFWWVLLSALAAGILAFIDGYFELGLYAF